MGPRGGRPGKKETGPKAKFSQLWPYMKEQRRLLVIAVILSLLSASVNLAQPLVVGRIISTVQQGADVLPIALLLLVITLLSAVAGGAMYFVLAKQVKGLSFQRD